jgi:hypothetical protein
MNIAVPKMAGPIIETIAPARISANHRVRKLESYFLNRGNIVSAVCRGTGETYLVVVGGTTGILTTYSLSPVRRGEGRGEGRVHLEL